MLLMCYRTYRHVLGKCAANTRTKSTAVMSYGSRFISAGAPLRMFSIREHRPRGLGLGNN